MKWRIFMLITLAAMAATMVASPALAQQEPPLQAQEHAKPKADLNLPEEKNQPEEKSDGALKPGSESVRGQEESGKQVRDLNPSEDKAVGPTSEKLGATERALEQRNPNANLNAPSPTSEKPGPTERAPEQANLAPTEGYDNCTFSGGRTTCTKTVVLSDKTETRKTEATVACTTPGRNPRPGTKTVTTSQDFRIVTTQTTTDEFAGRSGNQKSSTSSEPITTETPIGNPKVTETGCRPL
jgi:hypothetical protein